MLKSILSSLTAVAAVAAVVGLSSAPANAIAVDVTYNLTTVDFFSTASGGNTLTGTGSLTVRFANATAGGHVGAGNLNVQAGTLMLNGNFTALSGLLSFTGFQNVTFAGGPNAEGQVTAGGAFNLATVGHIVSGSNHCSGSLCGLAGFTASVVQPLTSGPRAFIISNGILAGFPSLGPQTLSGTGLNAAGNNVLTLTAIGQEVGRAVVPEPGTGLLLGLGLVGLGLSGGAFGVRRRR